MSEILLQEGITGHQSKSSITTTAKLLQIIHSRYKVFVSILVFSEKGSFVPVFLSFDCTVCVFYNNYRLIIHNQND